MFAKINRTSSVEETNIKEKNEEGCDTPGITAEVQEEKSAHHKTPR